MNRDKSNKTDFAYNMIKEKILTLEFAPGSQLKEIELSDLLGLSRTPVREAIQRLEAERLVEQTGKNLNKVAEVTLDNFIEIYQVREVLENLTVKLATLNWTDYQEIIDLREILDKQKERSREVSIHSREFLYYDKMFHKRLATMTRNSLLEQGMFKYLDLYYRYNHVAIFVNRGLLTTEEHIDILQSIEQRDVKRAQSIMKSHLLVIRESIMIGIAKKDK